MTHDIGDKVSIYGFFISRPLTAKEHRTFLEKTAEGKPTEALPEGIGVAPSTVTATVRTPANVKSNPSTSTPATGVYTASVIPEEAGTYRYAFDGTGSYVAAGEGSFPARERAVER